MIINRDGNLTIKDAVSSARRMMVANYFGKLLGAVFIAGYACQVLGSDTYDIATSYLTIPSLTISGTTYTNVVIRLDSIAIISVDPTPASLTWSSPYRNGSLDSSWFQANAYCSTSTINGTKGWRLPTQPELTNHFSSGTQDLGAVWTSTAAPGVTTYYVVVASGAAYAYSAGSYFRYILCVR